MVTKEIAKEMYEAHEGINGEPKTLLELSEKYDMTRERIRQIIEKYKNELKEN